MPGVKILIAKMPNVLKLFAEMPDVQKPFAEMPLAGNDMQQCLTVASNPHDRMLRMFQCATFPA
jgi:hypothetical protein